MARLDGLAGLVQPVQNSINEVQNTVDDNKATLQKALDNARIMMYNRCFGLISRKQAQHLEGSLSVRLTMRMSSSLRSRG
jgi:hypothetical protein